MLTFYSIHSFHNFVVSGVFETSPHGRGEGDIKKAQPPPTHSKQYFLDILIYKKNIYTSFFNTCEPINYHHQHLFQFIYECLVMPSL